MVLDSFRLDGRVALVTGANRGLGRGAAVALAGGRRGRAARTGGEHGTARVSGADDPGRVRLPSER